jgi:site-specific DNA-methyltransferase (adenine-specific)
MATLDANSIDAIVTDPPYGLAFMGKRWDYDVPSVAIWAECLRVLKPGGHLLAFAGTRTQHRMAVRIEDAGFEIRDMIAWVYGSGFPKSLDVSKAIDKAAGAERTEVIGTKLGRPGMAKDGSNQRSGFDAAFGGDACGVLPTDITAPATDAAIQWAGWGTALKPALEPITVARKPLIGTVAQNVLTHGTGAINVDGGRVSHGETLPKMSGKAILGGSSNGWDRPWKNDPDGLARRQSAADAAIEKCNALGRWPANLIHDGSEEVVGLFPETTSGSWSGQKTGRGSKHSGDWGKQDRELHWEGDSGSAARFFYCAKASKADRDEGCEGLKEIRRGVGDTRPSGDFGERLGNSDGSERKAPVGRNSHPTVKPTDLMRYLCRLVTPPGGVVLDPFMGSGSTGKAAMLEGFGFIGIEREADYVKIARARINAATPPLLQAMEGT